MSAQDTFYQVSTVCVAIVVVILGYLAYQITITLKSLRKILDDVGQTADDITALKNTLKGAFMSVGSIFGKLGDRQAGRRARRKS